MEHCNNEKICTINNSKIPCFSERFVSHFFENKMIWWIIESQSQKYEDGNSVHVCFLTSMFAPMQCFKKMF